MSSGIDYERIGLQLYYPQHDLFEIERMLDLEAGREYGFSNRERKRPCTVTDVEDDPAVLGVGNLAAKLVGLPFEDFREDMEGREETEAFFAWRKAAVARPR